MLMASRQACTVCMLGKSAAAEGPHVEHLQALGKVLILQAQLRPEAEVERVQDQQVLRCQLLRASEVQICGRGASVV